MRHTHRALQVIAAYKFLKVAALLFVAIGAFGMLDAERFDAFTAWLIDLPIHHGHELVARLVDRLLDFGPRKVLAVGIAACVYAGVFAVEGWGLWREKRWAEYLTTIVTASLIPFEIWELVERFTLLKIAALVVNVLIVVYLVSLLRAPRRAALGPGRKPR